MAEFFHAGRTNTDDCYDAGKHVHGSRRVYGHDVDASRSRPDDCYNGGEVSAGAASSSAAQLKKEVAKEQRKAHDDHFCHHH